MRWLIIVDMTNSQEKKTTLQMTKIVICHSCGLLLLSASVALIVVPLNVDQFSKPKFWILLVDVSINHC